MTIEWGAIAAGFATFMTIAAKIYAAILEIIKAAQPLIDEAEQKALDGIIDRADRKEIVTKAVELLTAAKKIKIPWYLRPFLGRIIDTVARKLPDFQIRQLAAAVVKDAGDALNERRALA